MSSGEGNPPTGLGSGNPTSSEGELVISVSREGLLIDGDEKLVQGYIARIKTAAGNLIEVAGVNKGAIGNMVGVAAGAASVFAQSGQFVQLSAKSMEAIQNGGLIRGDPGFFRMTTVDSAGRFLEQLQWREVALGPTQMLSVQMIAVQMALKMAISEVNESIKRVEGKVESVLRLVEADRIGDIRGHHAVVERAVRNLDRTGALPATDWQSVASLGPELVIAVEKLRAHVALTLEAFDASKPVQDRADILQQAVVEKSIGETLNLLIVAEESLNKWQRLRLARVQNVEPEHRQQVVEDVRELLESQVAEDGKLYLKAKEVLESYGKTTRIDGFRYWSVRGIAKNLKKMQSDLDAFAKARRHQLAEWEELTTPSVSDAASHVVEVASKYTELAFTAASSGAAAVYRFFSRESNEAKEVVGRADASDDAEDGDVG